MNIMTKKKKYKFQMELDLEELTAVPFVSAVLFCKVHLLDGGKFVELSSCEEVRDHTVKWNTRVSFLAKMTAPSNTGVLDPCICRVSVRKEIKGGRSYQKLGFADINLSEFAGVRQSRRYLLEGYDLRHRQDNSMLKVTVSSTLLSGDPCFRTPAVRGNALPLEQPELSGAAPGVDSVVTTAAAGLQLKDVTGQKSEASGEVAEASGPAPTEEEVTAPGHSRNSSSQSGYSSLNSQGQSLQSHSQQSSSSESGHLRNASSGSGFSDYNSIERAQARKKEVLASSRFDATRVDPEDMVNDLLQNTNFNTDPNETAESSGLQLFVGRDGSTAFSSRDATSFEPVVISKK